VKRTAKIIKSAPDGKRFIAVDKENATEIMHFLQDNNLSKKFELICSTILSGIKNSELYDKEDINSKCKNVTAMKFKSKQNTRIYCQEVKQKDKTLVIVTSELLPKKKNQKNKDKEINLIEKVAGYDYQIEDK
jgi:hypothetical protein